MNVFLDSNQYLSDVRFGRQLESLASYLINTESQSFLSSVVLHESIEVYRRQINITLSQMSKSTREMRRLVANFTLPDVDIDQLALEFEMRMRMYPSRGGSILLELTNDDVLNLTKQAARRLRPFNAEGHGFRDAAIWIQLVSYAIKHPEIDIALITGNSKEFSDSEHKNTLHPDLINELISKKISNIRYYTSIPEFLKECLLPADAIDLSLYPDALIGTTIQLAFHEREIMRGLFEDEDGVSLHGISYDLSSSGNFLWRIRDLKSIEAYKLNDTDKYILVECETEVQITEYSVKEQIMDYARDEVYENVDDREVMLGLRGYLAIVISNGLVKSSDLLWTIPTSLDALNEVEENA